MPAELFTGKGFTALLQWSNERKFPSTPLSTFPDTILATQGSPCTLHGYSVYLPVADETGDKLPAGYLPGRIHPVYAV
jgi:hypothetical protein